MTIEAHAYARAGLLGNPSDGYFGKIISVTIKNFHARVSLKPSDELRVVPAEQDRDVFQSMGDLVEKVKLHGYYGGDRLIKAGIKRFYEYFAGKGIELPDRNFTVEYGSTIPRQLGMAGSSAIITAMMRALTAFYGEEIPKEILPSVILAAEMDELGITGGLMDRVVQVYEGLVYMDLGREIIEEKGHGLYENMDPGLLPGLYIAYDAELGKVSGQVLSDMRTRFDNGDLFVIETLERIAGLAEQGKEALLKGDVDKLGALMDENFDLRARIMHINKGNTDLVDTARNTGASAKYAGSGGSIIGIYKDRKMFDELSARLGKLGATVIKPVF